MSASTETSKQLIEPPKTKEAGLQFATDMARRGDGDAVSLMTLRKAKGLEFPHVYLPGIIPSTYGDLDEERRLTSH